MPGRSERSEPRGDASRARGARALVGFACLTLAGLAAGCADVPGAVAWLGEEPHLSLHGVNEGVPTNADIVEQELLDMAFFHCERTYEVPVVSGVQDPSLARLVATKISFFFKVDDRPRTFTIELRQHDLQADAPGSRIRVVPRREGELIAPDEVLFEMSIADFLLDEEFLHAAAKFGDVTLHEFTGAPPVGSRVIPAGEGYVGFTFDVVFHPEGYFRGSVTAPCTANQIVPVVP